MSLGVTPKEARILNRSVAKPDAYAHVLAEYTDDELKASLVVGTGKRHGLDSRVIEKYKEVWGRAHQFSPRSEQAAHRA